MQYFVENDIFSENLANIFPKIVVKVSENQKFDNEFWRNFFHFCLVMLSMTSMTASYATDYTLRFQLYTGCPKKTEPA